MKPHVATDTFKFASDSKIQRSKIAMFTEVSHEQFRLMSDFSPDIINLIHIQSKQSVYFNRDMVFGYTRSEFLSLKPSGLIFQDDLNLMENHYAKVIQTNGHKPEEVEFRVICKDGTLQWLQMRQIIILNPADQTPQYLLAIATPIEDRKQTELELLRANSELDNFLYRASHDLKAPMKSIKGLVNLIKMENDEQKKTRYLDLINFSIEKLDNYISDMTNYSRNTRMDIEFDLVDFEEIYHEQIEMLQYKDNYNRIQKIFSLSQTADFVSDKMRISILFSNILHNAIKFQNLKIPDSFIKMNITVTDDYAQLSFIDNGIGIKQQYLDKIFDMFFKGSENSVGSGLGLYVVQQILLKLGGSIDVKSSYGEGSSFNLVIPNQHKNLPK